jgi:hypothetical protein
MSPVVSLLAEEMHRFSVCHPARLVGEHQHCLGSGCMSVATDLRLQVEANETAGAFELAVSGGLDAAAVRRYTPKWERAVGMKLMADHQALEGLAVSVDFGDLTDLLPAETLLTSPALAAALTAAAAAHRGREATRDDVELADAGAEALASVASEPRAQRFFSDVLVSIAGGALYVDPGGERINVQPLLPPESLILAVVPGLDFGERVTESERELRKALMQMSGEHGELIGDRAFEAIFAMDGDILQEEQTGMLYGLLRVRQMLDSFMEHLGEPFVDNDRLAEICDDESAILKDYFGFQAEPYGEIRRRAAEAGALGAKYTWAFGSYPAAIILAPDRRDDVLEALREEADGEYFWPVDMEPAGLLRGGERSW